MLPQTGSSNVTSCTVYDVTDEEALLRSSCRFTSQYTSQDYSSAKGSRQKDGSCNKSKSKSNYKHVPHKDKPPHLVARRNARERRRVQAVNSSFAKLRKYLPYQNKNKRLSKVKTLKIAIDYIHHLQDMIDEYDAQVAKQHHMSYVFTSSHEEYLAGKLMSWQAPIESHSNNREFYAPYRQCGNRYIMDYE